MTSPLTPAQIGELRRQRRAIHLAFFRDGEIAFACCAAHPRGVRSVGIEKSDNYTMDPSRVTCLVCLSRRSLAE